ILQRVTDGYRKLRNTARFALGNLHGFDPVRDTVSDDELLEIDRWALAKLNEVVGKVRAAYDGYEFHLVYHLLSEFCTVTLSARYFDIIKDRLYTFAPRNQARRSAQTALYRIVDALARLLAPILVFTADEIWENLPKGTGAAGQGKTTSVHLALFPEVQPIQEADLLGQWETIFKLREEVLRELEAKRIAKEIGSSLEARVKLHVSQDIYDLLKPYQDTSQLRYIFIVSQTALPEVDLKGNTPETTSSIRVEVERAEGQKCERCWNYSTHVGESAKYPTVCERCVEALEEIDSETSSGRTQEQ
ncbi:MAG TPA: class I tRNA ligase family protein, partial [Pyrinomonadaceae bacterium]|nr:class I tRNA ligase family protein [Pyrinomonadaceae bacterium]